MSAKPSTHSGAVAVVKDTSREAYAKLDTPTLDERVYRAFHDDDYICTRRELAYCMDEQASTIAGAVNRLIKSGMIVVLGKTECEITGRTVEALYLPSELGTR